MHGPARPGHGYALPVTTLQQIQMVSLEVRVGGRFGPTPQSGRRGRPLFRVDVPETLRDYLVDLEPSPLPDGIGAVHIYLGAENEPIKSWTSRDHETGLARQAEIGDLDGQATGLRAEIRALEQQRDLSQRALELTQAQMQQATATRREEVDALTRERERSAAVFAQLAAQEAAERERVAAALQNLDAWAQQRQTLALADVQRFSAACEGVRDQVAAAAVQVGALATGVMEREGAVARLSATNQAEMQSGALDTIRLVGQLVAVVRDSGVQALATTAPAGPSPADKLIELAKGVVLGDLGQALAHRLGGDGFRSSGPPPADPPDPAT